MTSLLVMFGKRMVSSIDGPDVERYKVWRLDGDEGIKAVKSITLRHDLDAFSKLFEWAIKMGYATVNPVRAVSKPSAENAVRMYILSDAEEFLYFEAALARSMDLHDVTMLINNQGRPEGDHRNRKAERRSCSPDPAYTEGQDQGCKANLAPHDRIVRDTQAAYTGRRTV